MPPRSRGVLWVSPLAAMPTFARRAVTAEVFVWRGRVRGRNDRESSALSFFRLRAVPARIERSRSTHSLDCPALFERNHNRTFFRQVKWEYPYAPARLREKPAFPCGLTSDAHSRVCLGKALQIG